MCCVYRCIEYIPPSIVLPIQQVGGNCASLRATRENMAHKIPSPCIFMFTVPYIPILYCTFCTQLCVNNIEVTVNTCTCTDVFTVITTKDQSGGIYNSAYSTGGQGFMAVSKQTSDSVCLLP